MSEGARLRREDRWRLTAERRSDPEAPSEGAEPREDRWRLTAEHRHQSAAPGNDLSGGGDPRSGGPGGDPGSGGPGSGGPVAVAGGTEPRRRLHPLSPLLHGAKYLAVVVAALSIQGAAQLGWRGFLGYVVIAMVGATAYAVVTWLVTGYHVVGRELRIYTGLLVRRTRAIPLERLQAVEMVRPLLARLAGLAELRLEVVGRGKTEAPLAFLPVDEAAALRQRLLALAVRAGAAPAQAPAQAPTAAGLAAEPTALPAPGEAPPAAGEPAAPAGPDHAPAPPPPAPPEHPLHTVVNRDVLVGQLLTPQVMFLPFAIALVVTQYWFGAGAWSFVVFASMAAAIIGVVRQPVRRIMSDWNFRLALQDPPPGKPHPGLRVRQGLTETRSQTVPLNRVQAVGVTWPLLWRGKRWLRCRLHVAGIAAAEQGGEISDQLLPVGDLATGRRLTGVALPGVDLTALRLAPPPRRARWLAPLRAPILGTALDERVFATRDGRITRELVVVPFPRIQSVRVVQGPLQRQLGLANVYADTAGSLTAVAYHRELAEARWFAAELTERARAAREADQPDQAGQAGQPASDRPAPPPDAPPPGDGASAHPSPPPGATTAS